MHRPKQSHKKAALRVVRYITEAPGMGLLMPAGETTQLISYCDSDWGACLDTRRLVIGYLVKFGGGLILYSVKEINKNRVQKHGCICSRNNLDDFPLQGTRCVYITTSVSMICDRKTITQIAANPIFHKRTKHIDTDCYFVRERIYQGMLKTELNNTKDHLADILTKSLENFQHNHLLGRLKIKDIFQP